LSMLLRVYVYRDLRHGTSCGLTRVSASKDSRAAPNERLFDFMRSTAQSSATKLRNGDSEMPTSNAETLRTPRSAERKLRNSSRGIKNWEIRSEEL